MKSKHIFAAVFCVLLLVSVFAISVNATIGTTGISSKGSSSAGMERVIVDDSSGIQPKSISDNGCTVKHTLKGATSYDCPAGVSFGRPAMILHPMDFNADVYMGADKVWSAGFKGSGQTVIIIDTGIDARHQELKDSIVGQYDFVNNDNVAEDGYGHGTMVASLVTGNGVQQYNGNYAKGVAPDVSIYMLKVCDNAGRCYEDDIAAAMDYAATLNGKVVSISLGGTTYSGHCDGQFLADKVNWLADQGKFVVVAAGNSGSGVAYPGCASKAIAVGATDLNGNIDWWSGRGPGIEIFAPGDQMVVSVSCMVTGNCNANDYSKVSGTSCATPQVSGAIALLLNAKPTATITQIKDALFTSVTSVAKCFRCSSISKGSCVGSVYLDSCTTADTNGAGILNVYQAYTKLTGGSVKDSDNDGTPDSSDLCPTTYSKDCNGCPNLCTGCAMMSCTAGKKPTCTAGACSATTCPGDGCGKGGCATDKWGDFPISVPNTCTVSGNSGTCSQKTCTATCTTDTRCQGQPSTKCWSSTYTPLPKSTSQMQKFCLCTMNRYAYKGYSSKSARITATIFSDYKENFNWAVTTQISSYAVTSVQCQDGKWYYTNQDYYHV